MPLGPKVDCLKIRDQIVLAGRLRAHVPDGYSKPEAQCERELLLSLRAERLALTDYEFRRKYLEYIKK